ncbi:hypothetical protein [Cellulomonas triticagri]|uniref:hypothetical protein n=1 Tax=Cellulomonas triticagri TaxID=2483352 RepID=UPI001315A392|nr:hypothetical protein [Cellulomonas triticagri]
MTTPEPRRGRGLGTAVDLWAVRFLTTFSLRIRVRVFLTGALALSACAAAATAGLAFAVVSAVVTAAGVLVPGAREALGWSAVLLLAGLVAYGGTGSLLRETFSRVRYAVPASPVRGLWLAMDLPLRQVVLAERGTEQLPRALVSGGLVLGTAGALTSTGSVAAAAAALLVLGLVVAAEGACHLVAMRAATRSRVRRAPVGVWELYVVVLGLAGGAVLPPLVRIATGVRADAVADALAAADVVGLRAAALVLVLSGVVLAAVVTVVAIRRPAEDVPLLGIDAPAIVAARFTLGRRWRRPTWFGTVAWGTGSMTPQPAVLALFRLVLAATAVAVGVRLAAGPVAMGVEIRGVALDAVVRSAVALTSATVAGLVTAGTVVVAGHGARLWHYRTLRELGSPVAVTWAAHVAGAVVQCAAFGAALALAAGAITGRAHPEIVSIAVVVALADHLAESLFARPTRDEGERTGSTATAVVGIALVAPALVAAVAGGVWAWVSVVYVVVLAGGGLLCFEIRSRNIPVVAVA